MEDAMATTTVPGRIREVDPRTLSQWLDAGQALLVDVRPPEMFAAERIDQATSVPLPTLGQPTVPDPGARKLVFQCEVGIASEKAAKKMRETGWDGEVYHLRGGIRAWKRANLPVERTRGASALSLQRQVQIAAGSLVVLGVVLGLTVTPWFLALAAFVGAGLVFAGATGTCGMAAVLSRLPHNRRNLNV
jgi:rhodanese-related sulfurtransferase